MIENRLKLLFKFNNSNTMSVGIITVDGVPTTFYATSKSEPPTDEIIESRAYSTKHFNLFDAAKAGDYEEFMKHAAKATKNDLEWCIEKASDLRIIKYIVEERKIKNFVACGYKQAIRHHRVDIVNYFETRQKKWCIKRLKAWIENFLEDEVAPDETDPKYSSPIVEPKDDPRAYCKITHWIIDTDIFFGIQTLNGQKEFLLLKKRLNLIENTL